ncbi:hypothetical protein ELH97_31290 (plasmid) [Rhizobium leguminosarum]|uniref:hypothetical protein n=1 Tax=Rhizobium leguminosarum TaxID=384 RepID=UPI00102F312C|nr:hypothetical protein [Rhizobium leguminosarum]TAX86321.1 hypothetical protein ELH97_31290 [Rhizobium leguminosarum]
MSRYYGFRWRRSARAEALVIFAPTKQFLQSQLVTLIDNDVRDDLWPDQLIMLVPEPSAADYVSGTRSLLNDRVMLRLKDAHVGVAIATYDAFGIIRCDQDHVLQGSIKFDKDDFYGCIQAGIASLVRKRQAIIRSSPGHHFVHPNKSHSEGFLRASNMLVQGNEIGFLAFSLLKYLTADTKKIWIDSSSIASLVYAASLMRQLFNETYETPEIQSFSSYQGLELLRSHVEDGCLVIISATATGRLRKRILDETNLSERSIVTLFSAAPKDEASSLVYDVRRVAEEMGSPSMDVYETDCPLCRDGSRPVELLGDQFLADSFKSIPYTLKQTDAPNELDDVMERYRSKNAFSLTQSTTDGHTLRVRLAPSLKHEIEELTSRYVSVSTSHILPLDDDDSRKFARGFANAVARAVGRRPQLLKGPTDLEGLDSESVTGILVVAGCIGSGRALQAISRDLRVFENKPRTFFIALAKHSDGVDYRKLVADLQHNNDHHKHVVEVIDRMDLPYPNSYDAWTAERELLIGMRTDNNVGRWDFRPIAKWIDDRLNEISGDVEGNTVFLPTTSSRQLRLRPTFAFWKNYNPKNVSQLDVFATVASVLEHARRTRGKGGFPPLARSAFFANILHWENFSRYNDGIIQACLLRAAHRHELNYATESEHSTIVCKILLKLFERANTQQGEGALEFALALATKRLQLRSEEIETLVTTAENSPWDDRIKSMLKFAFRNPPHIPDNGEPPA